MDNNTDIGNAIFNKTNGVFLLWFLAIYIFSYFLLGTFLNKNNDNSNFQGKLGRGIDIIFLAFLILFFISLYFFNTESNREKIIQSSLNNYNDIINDPKSIISIFFLIIFMYVLFYLFRIPLSYENKPFTVLFIETILWITFVIICFVDFFKYVLNISLTDLFKDAIIFNYIPQLNVNNLINPTMNSISTSKPDSTMNSIFTTNTTKINPITGNIITSSSGGASKKEADNVAAAIIAKKEADNVAAAIVAKKEADAGTGTSATNKKADSDAVSGPRSAGAGSGGSGSAGAGSAGAGSAGSGSGGSGSGGSGSGGPISGDYIVNGNTLLGNITSNIPQQKDEVFNISNNLYTYDDAQAVCSSFGAKLATYEQIEDAYNNGADWCSYGWSENQMAFFPTQKSTWSKYQKIKGHENDCGRPGVNGGYMGNPNILFGVNCYGKKRDARLDEITRMEENDKYPTIPRTPEDLLREKKVNFYKENADKLFVINSFNRSDKWSEY
jgi:uncharacterized membrane protein YgcG